MREVTIHRGNLLDRAIEAMFPAWGAERLMSRTAIELGYRAASQTRIGRRRPISGSADSQLEREWDRRKMVDRSRQLERDSAVACGLFDRDQENVVGPQGIRPKSTSKSKRWQDQVGRRFQKWADQEADAREMSTFWELQPLLYRSRERDGDVGAIKLSTGELQPFESDQLVSPYGKTFSGNMVDGVQLDFRGRAIAYHVVSGDRARAASYRRGLKTSTIPASDVIFAARRKRLGQTRGTPVLSGSAHYFDQLDGYLEATITAARMAACFGLVIHSKDRRKGLATETDIDGNPIRKMRVEPAKILEVGLDDKVTQVNPTQPGSQFGEITATFGRLLGIPFGVPLEVAFMDFSRTTYSSARAALLQAYAAWRWKQQSFIQQVLAPVWTWKVQEWVDAGELKNVPDDYLAHDWVPPGWSWIDPMREIEATLMAVDGGLDTLQDVAMRMGGADWWNLIERRKAELGAIKEAGIEVGRSAKTRDTGQPPAPPDAAPQDPTQDPQPAPKQ